MGKQWVVFYEYFERQITVLKALTCTPLPALQGPITSHSWSMAMLTMQGALDRVLDIDNQSWSLSGFMVDTLGIWNVI